MLLVKFEADDIMKYFSYIFSENMIWHFIQIVSIGDNLYEMTNLVSWEKKNKKNVTNLSSAKLAQRVAKANGQFLLFLT